MVWGRDSKPEEQCGRGCVVWVLVCLGTGDIGFDSIENIHAAMISQIHQKNCQVSLVYGISFKK